MQPVDDLHGQKRGQDCSQGHGDDEAHGNSHDFLLDRKANHESLQFEHGHVQSDLFLRMLPLAGSKLVD
jgi:hypothetical protein